MAVYDFPRPDDEEDKGEQFCCTECGCDMFEVLEEELDEEEMTLTCEACRQEYRVGFNEESN